MIKLACFPLIMLTCDKCLWENMLYAYTWRIKDILKLVIGLTILKKGINIIHKNKSCTDYTIFTVVQMMEQWRYFNLQRCCTCRIQISTRLAWKEIKYDIMFEEGFQAHVRQEYNIYINFRKWNNHWKLLNNIKTFPLALL